MRCLKLILIGLLLLLNSVVLVSIVRGPSALKVSVLDVGQGDAILIQSPTGKQMLIDGGRDHSVLRTLPAVMGPLDRSIDIVVETHPDSDHIGGLPGVLERYAVRTFIEPGVESDTNQVDALNAAVARESNIDRIRAERGMRIHLGGGAYADILYPDRQVIGIETNTGSIVMRVVYGQTAFMLTGDAPSAVEDWLVTLDGESLRSNVLKAGHHGSKTSTDDAWLAAVRPSIVAISAGKDNTYGHPAPDVVERIHAHGAETLSTIEEGTITFVSDGVQVSR